MIIKLRKKSRFMGRVDLVWVKDGFGVAHGPRFGVGSESRLESEFALKKYTPITNRKAEMFHIFDCLEWRVC